MSKTNTHQEFMPAYDINDSDGSATLNLMKAALLPRWRETFKKLEAYSQIENKGRRVMNKKLIKAAKKLENAAQEYRYLYQKGSERDALIWIQNNTTGEGVFIADNLNTELIKERYCEPSTGEE